MSTPEERVGGLHAVTALLEEDPGRVRGLWVLARRKDRRLERLVGLARRHGVALEETDKATLDDLLPGGRHQGVVAAYAGRRALGEPDLDALVARAPGAPLVLVLDGVQDPHNLGACLRSADAAGAGAVVVPRDRAVGLTATVRKAASGAAETVPLVTVTNLARTLARLGELGLLRVGLAGEGDGELYGADLSGPLALVLGAEGRGLRRLTREQCDALARIPMAGRVASLNVSVAAGVALFEALRQRRAA